MKILYTLAVGVLLLATTLSVAQNNSISDFTIESSDFYLDDEATEIISSITKTGNTLTWTQNHEDNSLVTTFNILSSSGTWDNATSTGNISLTIEVAGNNSTLSLSGSNDNISLQISTAGLNNTSEELIFDVTSIVYL
ncbi:hypothetical protein [uncultured Winogradskyella sp.]|uniref:hypothetical protein n=1 Tax=uncultured Winogradskyella sp. TaxID=395353 RepID=UPI002612A829|nr:hypothetical protein [uncultured Winogradskyella sp.]